MHIIALFNSKIKNGIVGRKEDAKRIKQIDFSGYKIAWFHCASYGEFEQGLPLMDKIKKQGFKILVTFFSPSGYDKISKTQKVDFTFYLPFDFKNDTKQMLDIINPKIIFIVKYEYWYNFLFAINNKKIPCILYSSIFRKQQIFFKWYGILHRIMLNFFSIIYVQNEHSLKLLKTFKNVPTCEIVGDTRFDRVLENAKSNKLKLKWLDDFKNNNEILVVGSSWNKDVKNIAIAMNKIKNLKIIITPHEINKKNINFIKQIFDNSICLSEIKKSKYVRKYNVVIIDCIGLLSRLYFYADYVYVGGGFNKSGIHNILEPAVFGKTIFIGPNFSKFNEAIELKKLESIFSCSNSKELFYAFSKIFYNKTKKKICEKINKSYVNINAGVADKIMISLNKNNFV